jgi:hypothetical protein
MMKSIAPVLFLLLALAACNQPQPTTQAGLPGKFYGEQFAPENHVGVQKAIELYRAGNLQDVKGIDDIATKGLPLQIEGPVTSACQHKGCWMTMQEAGAADELFVRFFDYSFFVPKDLAGKTAVIKGNFYQDTTSVEDLRHYAEDEGQSAEEIAKITEPKLEFKFYASGVYVKE